MGCGQVIENCFAIKCGGCGKWGHGKYVGLKRSLAPQLDAHGWQWNCNTCLPIVKADIFMKDGNLQSAVNAVLATNNAARCKEIIQMYRRDAGGNTQHTTLKHGNKNLNDGISVNTFIYCYPIL